METAAGSSTSQSDSSPQLAATRDEEKGKGRKAIFLSPFSVFATVRHEARQRSVRRCWQAYVPICSTVSFPHS
jgi:hypothetical protein